MAVVDQLIDEISNKEIRDKIRQEVKTLRKDKQFGLVFEEHIPEHIVLYNTRVKKGARVIHKKTNEKYKVSRIENNKARCISKDGEEKSFDLNELNVIKLFGEAIYPALTPVEQVQKDINKPYHALIEADNYHALQVLEYLYEGKVDCIYIDPPYNTGARDWKYNNNYVDENDGYKHSKWLSFMKKRLLISKRLLSDDGTMVIAVDDNEMAHIVCLLEEIMPEYELTVVTVVHNPRGNVTKNFSQVHEYAIYLTPKGISTISRMSVENDKPRKLRRWGDYSEREERRSMFYPIYIKDGKITRIGEQPSDDYHPGSRNIALDNGEIEVWPIDQNDIERRWNYSRDTIEHHLDRIIPLYKDGQFDLFLTAELSPPKTFMASPDLDAGGAYGSTLVENITNKKFPYPKSLYAVLKCIEPVVVSKPDALVLDFFAGSGTTFHALSIINSIHGGNRKSVMVTNNEVHPESTAKSMIKSGIMPGMSDFEKHGICQAITFPRCKNAINGFREDNTLIPGELTVGKKERKEQRRTVRPLGFTTPEQMTKLVNRKQLAAALGLTQSKMKKDSNWYLEDSDKVSVLFNPERISDYCEAVKENEENVDTIYVLMPDGAAFRAVKEELLANLPKIFINKEKKVPVSDGLNENIQYFRLNFLDSISVELGREFENMLPFFWMMSGMVGELPINDSSEKYFIPDGSRFAVLKDEVYFNEFKNVLKKHEAIDYLFLVTDSEEAFISMKEELSGYKVIQLYKHYLENFSINTQKNI
ncbi:site-specific DNA-methyltransferase [Halobacillus sp. B29]|uniref:site-specific DNA-methyltransferase n=1 Tax=Halobacillus sp. B29 TaxID=3457432 RepID=UPI003FCDC281